MNDIRTDLGVLLRTLKAGSDELTKIDKELSGLTRHGAGYRDALNDVIKMLERILKEE